MANTEELYQALRNADAAGDTAAAKRLAEYIQSLPAGGATPQGSNLSPMEQLEAMQPSVKPTPKEGMTLTNNPLVGAGETALSTLTGLPAGVIGGVAGLGSRITGSSPQEAESKAADVAGSLTYSPRTETGQEYAAKLGELASALPPIMGEGAALAAPAARQVASQVAKVPGIASKAAAATTRAILPTPSPEALNLARKAQTMGMDVRPDMLYNSKFLKIFGEAMEHVPLSGATKEARQVALNKALIRQIGGNDSYPKLTPDIYEQAMNRAGKTIGDLAEKTPVNVNTKQFYDQLVNLSNSLSKATPDNQKVVMAYAKDLMSHAEDGIIPGTAIKELNSEISSQIRGAADGDLRRHLGNFQNILLDQLTGSMSKNDRKSFLDARTKYAKGMVLEPLVAKATGTEGDISPALLMGAVSKGQGKRRIARGFGGDMGDLAAIGQRFLKEPASSNTAERTAVLGSLGVGGVAAPHYTIPTVAGVYALANLYNRLGPSVSRAITGKVAPSTSTLSGPLSRMLPRVASTSRLSPYSSGLSSGRFPTVPLTVDDAHYLQANSQDED